MAREYRDSGIEWIGQIPKEWDCAALLRSLKGRITDGPHETPVLQENGIPFISVDSLNDTDRVDLSFVKKFISKELYKEYQKKANLEEGDILFSKAATIGKTAIVRNEVFMVWSPLAIIKPSPRMSFGKYMYYVLNCDGLIRHVSLLGTYNTQINVGMRALEKAIIPIPSLSEQQKIADYLDKVCGEVDEMVALQETMIEELKAYKQSVITEAVTRGLNPNVPMRNSGIDWIGEIPEGWSLSKAKFFVDITNGSDPKTEGDIPVYGSGASSFKTCGEYKNGPTVLIGRKGATLHIPHYIEGKYWNVDTAFDVKVKDDFDLKYYYYIAICFDYKYYVSQTTLPGMAQSSYNNMQIPVPPMNEQCAIASYLDTMCSEIDSLIALKQAKIEELKEYKKSVIYEYVTGKKEVV